MSDSSSVTASTMGLGIEAPAKEANTTKSFKSTARDKPSHSGKIHSTSKRGGGGGNNWGKATDVYDEDDYAALDEGDPNYYDEGAEWDAYPKAETKSRLDARGGLAGFKANVKVATKEFAASHDVEEFAASLLELQQPLFHSEVSKIVIRTTFDFDDAVREQGSHLLVALIKQEVLTSLQFTAGFRKLYQSLDETLIDYPLAQKWLKEFAEYAIANETLAQSTFDDLESARACMGDRVRIKQIKKQFDAIVHEYFRSEDVKDAQQSLSELKDCSFMHFEMVKVLVNSALDHNNRERELASQLLASGCFKEDQIVTGMAVLLDRVEDLLLDIPDIPVLLSWFLARAVSDEALPPAFLLNRDLAEGDLGHVVVQIARNLLRHKNASAELADIWSLQQRPNNA